VGWIDEKETVVEAEAEVEEGLLLRLGGEEAAGGGANSVLNFTSVLPMERRTNKNKEEKKKNGRRIIGS
jgi:hypothetical protein